ncbi:MAG: nitrite reductase/ring-hydroxylating ferredoxin subunit [Planctomycetota bacterium]|jgi:nitrite reductase/ring-hydroxylating ferredoxin subunit
MLQKLLRLFSRTAVLIPGGATLEEGTARSVDLGDPLAGGKRLILCKTDGDVHVLDAHCPHNEGGQIQAGPLAQGKFAVCPLHRYLFDPKTGKAEGVACAPAKRYKTKRSGDDLEVFL